MEVLKEKTETVASPFSFPALGDGRVSKSAYGCFGKQIFGSIRRKQANRTPRRFAFSRCRPLTVFNFIVPAIPGTSSYRCSPPTLAGLLFILSFSHRSSYPPILAGCHSAGLTTVPGRGGLAFPNSIHAESSCKWFYVARHFTDRTYEITNRLGGMRKSRRRFYLLRGSLRPAGFPLRKFFSAEKNPIS